MRSRQDETARYARSEGPSVQDLLDRERHPVPPALREVCFTHLGSEDVPRERYFSRTFHDREMERMWSRVWQMACREEEIPRVGDHVIYEIGDTNLIVVRSAADEIRAFHNACLHRGRLLRTEGGNVPQLRCPFHGFTWSLDGNLQFVPCRWDFPHVKDEEFRLPEARVASWGGFVFVNLDPDAMPLADYLAPIPAHFAGWRLEERTKAVHVAKVVAMNWKVGVEAFIESLHVLATHPQIMTATADTNTQYDVDSARPHVNRMITAMAVPSPHLGGRVSEQAILNAMTSGYTNASDEPAGLRLPAGVSAREFLADLTRKMLPAGTGLDPSEATDSELLDAIQYFVFPNFFPWGGVFQNIVYRFRPVGNDPERALMEVMLLRPVAKGEPRPAPAQMRLLGPGERWTDAPELGILAPIFEQDMGNMPNVQRGLRALRKPGITLANYQESRIRHLHQTLDRYLAGEELGRPATGQSRTHPPR
jgi:phenylpropionate dioxygenase-like ring-hydroxylating dioxygenase large terminal subunit